MATFSQGFLANLGRPAMTESLLGVGTAVGNIPAGIKNRRLNQQEIAELEGVAPGSAEELAIRAKYANLRGNAEDAVRYAALAETQRTSAANLALAQQKALREAILFAQGQDDRTKTQNIEETQGTLNIARLQDAVRTGKNAEGQDLNFSQKDRVRKILVQLFNKDGTPKVAAANAMTDRIDGLLGRQEIDNFNMINFVGPEGDRQTVLANDEETIKKLLDDNYVETSRLSSSGGLTVTTSPDGTTTFTMGGSSGGITTRNAGIDQQTRQLQTQLASLKANINKLKRPERAFGVQGAIADSDVVGIMMQIPGGEFTTETVSKAIGVPINEDELSEIKAVRQEYANLVANARTGTRGIQSAENASTAELAVAKEVLAGLDAKNDFEAVMAGLEMYEDLLRFRAMSVGKAPQITVDNMSNDELMENINAMFGNKD